MASRPRRPGESFKLYRKRLKKEEKKLKQEMRGTLVWPGAWGQYQVIWRDGGKYLFNPAGRVVRVR